jgi:hypothetical protein
LRGVNDLFIGPKSHTSALYEIEFQGAKEAQSSSGLIVSTGLGSTAWLKSIVTGSLGIANAVGHRQRNDYEPMPWDTDHLIFAVREPFGSRASETTLLYGEIDEIGSADPALAHARHRRNLLRRHGIGLPAVHGGHGSQNWRLCDQGHSGGVG